MKRLGAIILVLALAACGASYRDARVGMASMAVFDAEKYAGLWYEVASFPTPFQSGCTNTTAEYQAISDGQLSVSNRCIRDGQVTVIDGSAQIVGPGRLAVKLDGVPVTADYWVLWVDDAYQTAVVGVPSGRAGWILNRTPKISPDRLKAARDVLAFNGYTLSSLRMTPQGVK